MGKEVKDKWKRRRIKAERYKKEIKNSNKKKGGNKCNII